MSAGYIGSLTQNEAVTSSCYGNMSLLVLRFQGLVNDLIYHKCPVSQAKSDNILPWLVIVSIHAVYSLL